MHVEWPAIFWVPFRTGLGQLCLWLSTQGRRAISLCTCFGSALDTASIRNLNPLNSQDLLRGVNGCAQCCTNTSLGSGNTNSSQQLLLHVKVSEPWQGQLTCISVASDFRESLSSSLFGVCAFVYAILYFALWKHVRFLEGLQGMVDLACSIKSAVNGIPYIFFGHLAEPSHSTAGGSGRNQLATGRQFRCN